jgi:uncharacterized surface protein with fasciclin (FAS1) repeats
MKTKKRVEEGIKYLYRIAIIAVVGILCVACPSEVIPWEPDSDQMVITDYVYNQNETSSEFIEFAEALKITGIENLLRVRGPFTLLLPTDEAMEAYYAEKGVSSINEIDAEELEDFVYNHVLQGEISSGAIGLGTLPFKNGLGDFVASDFQGIDILLNKVAIIIDRDIFTSNGYVHHIDHVLEPITATVVDVLNADPGYSIFSAGLVSSGLADTLESVIFPYGLSTARSRYTVLAVSDTLYNRMGINSVDDLIDKYSTGSDLTSPDNEFYQYMEYHCLSGTHYFSDFQPDAIYYLISQNNYINIKVEEDFKINKTDSSYVGFYYELSNIPAKNGVIHTVNTTLPVAITPNQEIIHQCTDYFDLQQLPCYTNSYYQMFYDGQNTFEVIKWEGQFMQYYYKIAHYLMDDDCLSMNGHFWIEFTTPKIRAGKYDFIAAGWNGGPIFSIFVDGEYFGVYDPSDATWEARDVLVDEIDFAETESHQIRMETTTSGHMFMDFFKFTPK